MQQSPSDPKVDASRRQVVVLGAVAAIAGPALAACSDGESQSVAASPTTADQASPTESASADPTESAAATTESATPAAAAPTSRTTSPTSRSETEDDDETTSKTSSKSSSKTSSKTSAKPATSKTSAKPAEDFSEGALIKLSSVPVGGSAKVGGTIVTRTGSNSVVGHDTTCTHAGCSVVPAGRALNCPCHGSSFDAVSGAVLAGPATRPLPRVGLVVKGGYVHQA